jgi:Putative Ig domain
MECIIGSKETKTETLSKKNTLSTQKKTPMNRTRVIAIVLGSVLLVLGIVLVSVDWLAYPVSTPSTKATTQYRTISEINGDLCFSYTADNLSRWTSGALPTNEYKATWVAELPTGSNTMYSPNSPSYMQFVTITNTTDRDITLNFTNSGLPSLHQKTSGGMDVYYSWPAAVTHPFSDARYGTQGVTFCSVQTPLSGSAWHFVFGHGYYCIVYNSSLRFDFNLSGSWTNTTKTASGGVNMLTANHTYCYIWVIHSYTGTPGVAGSTMLCSFYAYDNTTGTDVCGASLKNMTINHAPIRQDYPENVFADQNDPRTVHKHGCATYYKALDATDLSVLAQNMFDRCIRAKITYASNTLQTYVGSTVSVAPTFTRGTYTVDTASRNAVAAITGLQMSTSGAITNTGSALTVSSTSVNVSINSYPTTAATLTITILQQPKVSYAATNYVAVVGNAFTPGILPLMCLYSTVSSTVSPTLPTGLTISSVGVVTGTASASNASTVYTVTPQPADGGVMDPTSVYTFTLQVKAQPRIVYSGTTHTGAIGSALTAITPTLESSVVTGFQALTGLPAGLFFNTTTGVISGTPTETIGEQKFTVVPILSDDATVLTNDSQLSFYLTILLQPQLLYPTSTLVLTANRAITNVTPSVLAHVTNVTAATSLPTGLSLHPTTGVLSGTPTQLQSSTSYRIDFLSDYTPVAPYVSLSIEVIDEPYVRYVYDPDVVLVGAIGSPLELIPDTTRVIIHSISPALPSGFTLDLDTGVLSGTPLSTLDTTTFTVTVTGEEDVALHSGSNVTFSLTIQAAPVLTYTSTVQVAVVGEVFTLAPLAQSGLDGFNEEATITPSLPPGLSFDRETGNITGTPTEVSVSTLYTIHPTLLSPFVSVYGSTTQRQVELRVDAPAPLSTSFAYGTSADEPLWCFQAYADRMFRGQTFRRFLPESHTLYHSFAASLPQGLYVDPEDGAILGMPIFQDTTEVQTFHIYARTLASDTLVTAVLHVRIVIHLSALQYLAVYTVERGEPNTLVPAVVNGMAAALSLDARWPAEAIPHVDGSITVTPSEEWASQYDNLSVTALTLTGSITNTLSIVVRDTPTASAGLTPETTVQEMDRTIQYAVSVPMMGVGTGLMGWGLFAPV